MWIVVPSHPPTSHTHTRHRQTHTTQTDRHSHTTHTHRHTHTQHTHDTQTHSHTTQTDTLTHNTDTHTHDTDRHTHRHTGEGGCVRWRRGEFGVHPNMFTRRYGRHSPPHN